jgi:hypothetical protein
LTNQLFNGINKNKIISIAVISREWFFILNKTALFFTEKQKHGKARYQKQVRQNKLKSPQNAAESLLAKIFCPKEKGPNLSNCSYWAFFFCTKNSR